jgi:hypothetical protein
VAAGPPGLRSPDDAPGPSVGGAPGPGPATLAGMVPGRGGPEEETPMPQGGGAGGGMEAMLGTALQTAMKTEVLMTQMARQFPAASPALTSAKEGIAQAILGMRSALQHIMTSPGQPEPPSPAIGG